MQSGALRGLLLASYAARGVAFRAGITRSASGTGGGRRVRVGWGNRRGCRSAGDDRSVRGQIGLELVAQVGGDVDCFFHATGVSLGAERNIDDVANFRLIVGLELEAIFVVALERDDLEGLFASDNDLLGNLLALVYFAQQQRLWRD